MKSLFQQVDAVAIDSINLKPSPRVWNCGLLRYRGRLFLAYRYHLNVPDSRCATAIAELDRNSLQPIGKSQRLSLTEKSLEGAHHEDARLFMFKGDVYISYTEMRGYRPGVDYTCVMRYAKLKLRGNSWSVQQIWQPKFGANTGFLKEKNWIFFEHNGRLFCIYADEPNHVVVEVDGENVSNILTSRVPDWPWGIVRGGTPPLRQDDGTLLAIFHSSMPTETPPHYVRYYAGAYVLRGEPPFDILQISQRPIMAGSELDGHRVDPRYVEGWKPFVVFPCGLVADADRFLVSLGVNDWACAIARLTRDKLFLAPSTGSKPPTRFFRVNNGGLPVRVNGRDGRPYFLNWEVPVAGRCGMVGTGYLKADDPIEAEQVAEVSEEITQQEYAKQNYKVPSMFVYP